MDPMMVGMIVVLVIWTIGFYSLPSVIAIRRKVPHVRSVILANVLVGWTLMGWVVAMRMACQSKTRPVQMDSWSPRDG
jgi:Superinfection immunity protein